MCLLKSIVLGSLSVVIHIDQRCGGWAYGWAWIQIFAQRSQSAPGSISLFTSGRLSVASSSVSRLKANVALIRRKRRG